jgi:hypothetical protein
LLAHGQWFSPASSTTKTGRHERAEILLKVALKHQKSITILLHMFPLIMIPDKWLRMQLHKPKACSS